jgi:hypothetical protein
MKLEFQFIHLFLESLPSHLGKREMTSKKKKHE